MTRTYIIAEAGVNHNGDINMARELVDLAADAGADAVKFQTFRADKFVSRCAPKASYQEETTADNESQLDMIRMLELDENAHRLIIEQCRLRKIHFISSPFDQDSMDLLAYKLDIPLLKIPSGEITNGPYLLYIANTGKPVILSTGMSTLGEVETALGVLAFGYLKNREKPSLDSFRLAFSSDSGQKILAEKVSLMHCTTEYPAPFEEVNLRIMQTMRIAFGLPVGLSDHTTGIAVPIAAVALGASLIEKHFTIDRSLPGPDHRASLEHNELKAMVRSIRQVEKALGSTLKVPTQSELTNRDIVRKSLVAARSINKDDYFSPADIAVKRPGTGITPMRYWDFLGKKSDTDYAEDDLIT